jgi:hypothetical protein
MPVVNKYKIGFKIIEGEVLIGEYTAHVEADSAGDAERRAVRELKEANVSSSHEYLTNRIWDLGPVDSDNEEGPL